MSKDMEQLMVGILNQRTGSTQQSERDIQLKKQPFVPYGLIERK